MFIRTRNVASITAGLTKMVADLEAHAAAKQDENAAALVEAERLLKAAEEHRSEADKARKVAANISELLA